MADTGIRLTVQIDTSRTPEQQGEECRRAYSRRYDGKPETDTDRRFFNLRTSGYTGAIDQDGYAVENVDAWIATHTEVMR